MTTCGPLNFRAEGGLRLRRWGAQLDLRHDAIVARGSTHVLGGYVQMSYFLTGEHWGYDRRFGVLRPAEGASETSWSARRRLSTTEWAPGSWRTATRYVDLNDNGINGGQLTEHTFGLNWYLNDNFRCSANYLNISATSCAPSNSGTVHGFGMQAQWYF